MAFRKSPSNAQSAPKGKRLAAFSAYVEAVASGQTPEHDKALVDAINKRKVMQCAQLWNHFAQQVANAAEQQRPACRVLPRSQDLLPLP